jgi:hypothetical protein
MTLQMLHPEHQYIYPNSLVHDEYSTEKEAVFHFEQTYNLSRL